jgi:pimeloyl-[acyl-carrier protein] methyl ester esterase
MSHQNRIIVLLPGWGFDVSIWNSLVQCLAGKYRFISLNVFDLMEKDIQSTSLDSISKQLNRKIPNNAILLGWSLGGLIATHFCAKYPNQYNSLITIACTPRFSADTHWPGITEQALNNFRDLAIKDMQCLLKKFTAMSLFPVTNKNLLCALQQLTLTKQMHKTKLISLLNILINADLRNFFKKIATPSLHIFGEKDVIVPVATATALKLLNKNTQTKIIRNVGHAAFLIDALLLAEIISIFIARTPSVL